jgi:hypothetical protein
MCLRQGWSFNDAGSENGQTFMSYVAQAFTYAYRNGATAINYSFGSSGGAAIQAATDSAIAHEVVISAAAGNESGPVTGYLQTHRRALSASTTSSDTNQAFHSGPEVDISAPGSLIRSTVSVYSPGYAIYSGIFGTALSGRSDSFVHQSQSDQAGSVRRHHQHHG